MGEELLDSSEIVKHVWKPLIRRETSYTRVDKLGSEKQQKATKAVAQKWLQATEVLRRGDISRGPGQIYKEKGNSNLYKQPTEGTKCQGTGRKNTIIFIFKLIIFKEIIFFW